MAAAREREGGGEGFRVWGADEEGERERTGWDRVRVRRGAGGALPVGWWTGGRG